MIINIEEKKEKTYKPGDWFLYDNKQLYVLTETGNKSVTLIGVTKNHAHQSFASKEVNDINNIIKSELDCLSLYTDKSKWEHVDVTINVARSHSIL
jgi:hypothetical protein